MKRILSFLLVAITGLGIVAQALAQAPGSRPRGVAVSTDGKVVITTSEGSNEIVIMDHGQVTHLAIDTASDAHSWGVCFVDLNVAIVTVPTRTSLARIEWNGSVWSATAAGNIDYNCSEIIPSPNAGRVLVASRGRAPAGAASWQNGVYEVDYMSGAITQTFATERQPRGLAVSPDGSVLYVAHAQGALGGTGIAPNHSFADDPAILPKDGGSIVSFDMSNGAPIERFPVGSPVRGLAVWPPPGWPGQATHHRIYFTHLGGGAQGEALTLGGRLIPNVVSTIRFDVNNNPMSRVDAIVGHTPGVEATALAPAAVLHDNLAVRGNVEPELWITNSASGSVTRVSLTPLEGDFSVLPSPANDFGLLAFMAQDPVADALSVLVGRNGTSLTPNMAAASTSNMRTVFRTFDSPNTILVDPVSPPTPAFSSNPRGLAYDLANDRILVATYFDHELVKIDAASESIIGRQNLLVGTDPIGAAQRNFFTFGEGFDFREDVLDPLTKVNTLSCGSCHVDGHIDAKIRMTPSDGITPVAVPSVFDVGNTEWIFLDGRTTVIDDTDGCTYCENRRFFGDTAGFTSNVRSPHSPHADKSAGGTDDGLTDTQLLGRAWFDLFNCSRCHQGVTDPFRRTTDDAIINQSGPLVSSPRPERILNDRTQSFIGDCGGVPCAGDGASAKNRTIVGTLGTKGSINTPGLAGAWDNAPYMHDGRYRSLDEVLSDTWLLETSDGCAEGFFAAPLWECVGAGTVPDNWSNVQNLASASANDVNTVLPEFSFNTHKAIKPQGNWRSVRDYLETDLQNPAAYVALKDFISSLSSFTDPCGGPALQIANVVDNYDAGSGITTVSWTTSYPIACTGTYGESGQTGTDFSTPISETHQIQIPGLCFGVQYEIDIHAARRQGVCDDESNSFNYPWTNTGTITISNLQQGPLPACAGNVLTWTTNAKVSCLVEWGVKRQGMPNSAATPAGTTHTITIPTVQRKRYEARITASCPSQQDVELVAWNTFFCYSTKVAAGSIPEKSGLVSMSPNPFNPMTTIVFALSQPGRMSLKVYDVSGRLVRTLADEWKLAGTHEVTWNGRHDNGGRMVSGVYFLRMEAPSVSTTKKFVMVE